MRSSRLVFGVLARHLSPLALVRDLLVLAALGLLASFSILFVSRIPFDNFTYEMSLGYQAQSQGEVRGDGLIVASFADFELGDRLQSTGSRRSVNATAEVFPVDRLSEVNQIFSGAILSGEICGDGVVVDEASAAYLKIGVDDTVVVSWVPTDGDTQQAELRVCGLGRTWHPGGSLGSRGYVMLAGRAAEIAFPAMRQADAKQSVTYWIADGPTGAATKWESAAGVFGQDVGASAFLLVVVVIGFTLWLVGIQRATSGIRQSLAPAISIVRSIGAGSSGWLWLYLGIMLLMAIVSAFAAAVAARFVIMSWTALYISSNQIVVVIAALLAITVAAVVFHGWKISRSW